MINEKTSDKIDIKNTDEVLLNLYSSNLEKESVKEIPINQEIKTINIKKIQDNFILVDLSKKGNTAEILTSIENLKKGKEKLQIKLSVNSNSGYLPNSLEIAQAIHLSDNVDLHTKVNGSVGIAETVLAASGQIGFRFAEYGSTFTLGMNGKYPKDSNVKSLIPEDKRTLELLGKFTGKVSLISKFLLRGGVIDTNEAKKANIIDSFSEFKSKYLPEKRKSNRGRKSKMNADKEIVSGNKIETPLINVMVEENILETNELNSEQEINNEFASAAYKKALENTQSEKAIATNENPKELS